MFLIWLILLPAAVQGEDSDTRIVGGEDAPDNAFPWQASLRYYNTKEKKWLHFCGGSVIGKKWVLSAAHCTETLKPNAFLIWLGTKTLTEKEGERYAVDSIYNHEDFNLSLIKNDISLLKTNNEIKYNNKVRPVLLERRYIEGGEDCVVSGFGYINREQTYPERLQMLRLKTLDDNMCQKLLSQYPYNKKNVICVNSGRTGICQGDSGGPLVEGNEQIGIVSYGLGCGSSVHVFVRISSYIDWILDKVTTYKD